MVASHGPLNCIANAPPYVRSGLFLDISASSLPKPLFAYIVASLWLPKANILRCQTNDISSFVDDTSSSTACTHVNAYEVVL